MYELLWYWFAAILDCTVTLNTRIGKYISYKLDERRSAPGIQVMFQYFLIYFKQVIQDMISTFKAVGHTLQILFPSDCRVI